MRGMYLRCAVHAQPHRWKAWLSLAEFWYNTSYHSVLGYSPFKVLYGYDPPFAAAPMVPVGTDEDVSALLADRARFTEMLKGKLAEARNRMKLYADKLRTERQFQVGEMVLLKLQPYAQHSVVKRSCPKLGFKFYGHYKVLEQIGGNTLTRNLVLNASSEILSDLKVRQAIAYAVNKEEITKGPVSYTHLDVYKRQPWNWSMPRNPNIPG